jgi:transcriptional regulator GlxA family with amidase domain
VAILAFKTVAPITITGPVDILSSESELWKNLKRDTSIFFKVELVSLTRKPLRLGPAVVLHPHASITTAEPPDLILIPALDWNILESLKANRAFVPWIKSCSTRGTRVVSFCTGAFLLAETGLLDGRMATTHWRWAELFRKTYPDIDLQADRLIVDQGNVITAGAVAAFQDAVLYLIELYSGREAAVLTAKVLLLEAGRQTQLPFTIFSTQKNHNDTQILRIQHLMETRIRQPVNIADLARLGGMSVRNFDRRFREATGELPSIYMQKLRIEKAKRLLESGNDTVDQIMREVGYADYRSFRRLFRSFTALSPKAYRLKYRVHPWPKKQSPVPLPAVPV